MVVRGWDWSKYDTVVYLIIIYCTRSPVSWIAYVGTAALLALEGSGILVVLGFVSETSTVVAEVTVGPTVLAHTDIVISSATMTASSSY